MPAMLPTDYRWIPGEGRVHLHWRYAAVAWVAADGAFWVMGWGGADVSGSAASQAQGVRFVERMIGVRGFPYRRRKVRRGG